MSTKLELDLEKHREGADREIETLRKEIQDVEDRLKLEINSNVKIAIVFFGVLSALIGIIYAMGSSWIEQRVDSRAEDKLNDKEIDTRLYQGSKRVLSDYFMGKLTDGILVQEDYDELIKDFNPFFQAIGEFKGQEEENFTSKDWVFRGMRHFVRGGNHQLGGSYENNIAKGNYSDAIDAFSNALSKKGEFERTHKVYNLRGLTYYRLHEYCRAIRDFCKAINENKYIYSYTNNLGQAYLALGTKGDRLTKETSCAEVYSNDEKYSMFMARERSLRDVSEISAPKTEEKKCVEVYDSAAEYSKDIALKKAVKSFDEVLESRERSNVFNSLGYAHLELQEIGKAADYFVKATSFASDPILAFMNLSELKIIQGLLNEKDNFEAQKFYKEAKEHAETAERKAYKTRDTLISNYYICVAEVLLARDNKEDKGTNCDTKNIPDTMEIRWDFKALDKNLKSTNINEAKKHSICEKTNELKKIIPKYNIKNRKLPDCGDFSAT